MQKLLRGNGDPLYTVLVVDDSQLNRDMLFEILEYDYNVLQAASGVEALEIINEKRNEISCILLDITMAEIDGFEVLSQLNRKRWLDSLPVIIISAENNPDYIRRAYKLGAIDYINRPFDAEVVLRRVQNTILIYANQKKLAGLLIKQMRENEHNSNMMIAILGHIVEFRNKESGSHIANVESLTKIFLNQLLKLTPKYNLTRQDVSIISKASALHDLGKIQIPDEILNKPVKLTPKEFEEMKLHTVNGAKMLDEIELYKNEPLVKTASKICRWHHERYDGNGYPDGLKCDEIPIAAQVVSLADVYDALTSERCYKKAYNHETAVNMIYNGQCGVFNPILMECLKNVEKDLPALLSNEKINGSNYTINSIMGNHQ